MAENLSWVLPVITLSVSLSSAIIALFTYRRVSTKHLSKTIDFHKEINANQGLALFNINGSGSVQRLELNGEGRKGTKIVLKIDGESCLSESCASLSQRNSKFLTHVNLAFPEVRSYRFSIEMDLDKKFYSRLELFIDNKEENTPFTASGRVHYTFEKKPF